MNNWEKTKMNLVGIKSLILLIKYDLSWVNVYGTKKARSGPYLNIYNIFQRLSRFIFKTEKNNGRCLWNKGLNLLRLCHKQKCRGENFISQPVYIWGGGGVNLYHWMLILKLEWTINDLFNDIWKQNYRRKTTKCQNF